MSPTMRLAAVSSLLWTLAGPALATTDGVCFHMANVPAGDTLNLRADPSAKARIVGRYANSSEVIIAKAGRCGRWCKVSMSDGDGTRWGWVNARYLVRRGCP